MSIKPETVLVVHCVDTEGPLFESLDASFERLEELYDIRGIQRNRKNINALREGKIPLNGKEGVVSETLNGHLINYNDDWNKIDQMLERIMSDNVRKKLVDSYDGGWVFNWHCLDHVEFVNNPRRRTMGYHAIFDHYAQWLEQYPDKGDALHLHLHPMSTYKDAHRCATSFINSPHIWEVISRRIIERKWFPTAYRAGFQAERPDSHWFLEQWVPFDYSNMAMDDPMHFDRSIDFRNGRSGNWRNAPSDWSVYQPDHDDYQKPGNCRRWIARALNVMNRMASIDQSEVDKAFARAAHGQPTIMAIATHDFRDLETEVSFMMELIEDAKSRYPDVEFKYCEAVEAFRLALGINEDDSVKNALKLEVSIDLTPKDDVPNLTIKTIQGKVFGPQPWLAIETKGRRFIHDNLDFDSKNTVWHYAFHGDTLPIKDVKRIGVGAADKYGNSFVEVIDID